MKLLTSVGFQSFTPSTSLMPGFTTAGYKPWKYVDVKARILHMIRGIGKVNPPEKFSKREWDEEDEVEWIDPVPLCPSLSSGAKEEDVWSALERAEAAEEKKNKSRGWTTAKDLFSQKKQKFSHHYPVFIETDFGMITSSFRTVYSTRPLTLQHHAQKMFLNEEIRRIGFQELRQ